MAMLPFLLALSLFIFSLMMLIISIFISFSQEVIIIWNILNTNNSVLYVSLCLDTISCYFLSLISIISSVVLFFSVSYMQQDTYSNRFTTILFLFVLSMFLLVISTSLAPMLLGWDGLGVTSYLLVMYFQSTKSYGASMITVLTNRLGDIAILFILAGCVSMGVFDYVLSSSGGVSFNKVLLMLLIMAAMTKSAQVPFSAWLPAAMAAPTPVSALVHSSTLVTAGVYLLVRHWSLISSENMMMFIVMFGLITSTIAGVSAMCESDMKKIVALSTLSQLGVMMLAIGLGNAMLSYIHLLCHAYFKALLFICSGLIIHSMMGYQHLKIMGFVFIVSPFTSSLVMVSSVSLCGLPFMSGFYSKDSVIELMLMSSNNMFLCFMLLIATSLTVAYSMKLFSKAMTHEFNLPSGFSVYPNYLIMEIMMLILLVYSIFKGNMIMNFFSASASFIILPMWFKLLVMITISLTLLLMIITVLNLKLSKPDMKYSFIAFIWGLTNSMAFWVSLTNTMGKRLGFNSESTWVVGVPSSYTTLQGTSGSMIKANMMNIFISTLMWFALLNLVLFEM